ncbi:hypothetical protein GTU73_16825 [Rathayibacter sp. VKM Ac-2804]|uniref:hypothetical protein n=1 Tax=Rathayibacter sp. VKM Ac-2804 TaxID=2609257 RepID=UPI00132F263C|nr:hypothetical protein [Rathayibacter sp. VKM Ac-2804]QHF25492.1 hypothetical protein GTU73_16825 [Rathayibacter sp. VKM Ac-2804]
MTGRGGWWRLLLGYTALLWALALGACVLAAVQPDNWSYSDGDDVPLAAIVSSLLWPVAPALGTAAFAMTAATLAIGLVRAGPGSEAAATDVVGDPGEDAELGEGVLVELLPAGGGRRRS